MLLKIGDVIVTPSPTKVRTWWLVVERPDVGQNSVLVAGPMPKGFRNRRTHWSDTIVKQQKAKVNPPKPWPDTVIAAVAELAMTGKVGTHGNAND